MESSDDDTLSERSCVSEPSYRSERSACSSLSPCTSSYLGPPGDTLPWNLSKHERRKRKSQDSVLDPAERAVVRVADERDRVQKKTFTKWVNKHLIKVRKHIIDLYEDLRDGHNLISLLEVLSGVTLQQKTGPLPLSKRTSVSRAPPLILLGTEEEEDDEGADGPREKGRMRFHRLQNVQIALDFLKQRQVKLVNIRNDDITDGNPKLTLGLIWTIILHFQISEIYVSGESGDLTAKEKLLIWSKKATEGYPGLRCSNFTSSWSDGRMFNALLHSYRPDLIDMKVLDRQSNRENLEQAFEIAESLGVTRLLDAEDVDVPSPDEKSVITYVSSIYDAFPKIPEGGEGIAAHEVDQRWAEYQARFSSLLQWSRQHMALMANKNFPQNPVELKALYNEYVHFKETEIPSKEKEKGHIEHLYKLLEVWIEFGRIKLPQGLHPNDLEEEWGKLILEMLEREKALRPAVDRLELLLQRANKIQNMALDCEEKLTLAKNTLQADMSRVESGDSVQCEREMACYLQDCESLIRNLNQELKVLRDERYYQVEQLAFRVSCLQEELVSLRLQCSSLYRKGHFTQALSGTGAELTQRSQDGGLSLGQTLLGAVGAVGMMGAALLRRPMSRSQLVAMSSSEDEGSLRFIYELLGWVEETQDLLEQAEWGADLPSVEKHLQEHNSMHNAVEELMSSLQEARSYESKVSPNFKSSYSETLAKLEHQYCKLLEQSSWRLRSLESLHSFVSHCTDELIGLNEREEEELAFDWSHNNPNMSAKMEMYSEMRLELEEKQEVMRSLQETAGRLCQENHPAKQTVEAYSAALQTQWQWVNQLCLCVERHLKDNTAYFQFMGDARDCESYLRQLQDTIKRQYTCEKNSRLSKLEDLLQDSMEEKEQLIEYRSTVASLVGRAKTVVQLRPRSAETPLGSTTTPIKAICDYRQIEITINSGEECVLEDNSHRTKWKVISPTGNEAMVPSVCFTIPPPNQDAMDTAGRAEQLYQKVMSLWHQLHVNMKSVVSWNYLLKDVRTVSGWTLDTVRCQSPSERQQILDHLESHWSDFVSDSKESALFTATERQELERDVLQAQQHCKDLLLNMETAEKDESVSRSYLSELQNITLRLNDAEQRLMRGIQTPLPGLLSTDQGDNTVQIAEQEKLQCELDGLRSSLGDVSRRCIRFFEEKPSSSSIPALRSELNYAVEKTDKLHNLSTVFLQKLKTVDVLIRSLDEAESQVKKYESRLSEEDIVPPDTAALKNLRELLHVWQAEVSDQEGILLSLQSEVVRAKEAGSQLSKIHPERSPELDRYQDKANQMSERWTGVKRQIETRQTDLEALGSSLQLYRDGHAALIKWIEQTTERQENTQPGQTDSKALSEQLAQQTALVAEIEKNQTKLDDCQTHSKQYCTAVKDYELQLMTYRAFVESTHKSSAKRRRLHSSSDAITQEFMDLRTRYTALVTLTTQHVKYISDALRRLEEEEKEVEEEKQARVGQVSDLLGWVKGLQGRAGGPNAESSLAAQQAITEQLASKKDDVAEAIRSTEVFLMSKQASKLSPEERTRVEAQLTDLKATYSQLCASSNQQLQQLEQQLAKEEERKTHPVIAGVIDLGTVETFPVFRAAQRGLIDQDTCLILLEAQLVWGGLLQPHSGFPLSLELGETEGLVNQHMQECLSELNSAVFVADKSVQQNVASFVNAVEAGLIREELGLRILALQLTSGGLNNETGPKLTLEQAEDMKILTPRLAKKLHSMSNAKDLIDPNTAEKLSLSELQQRCVIDEDSGFLLLPVKQQPGGTVYLRSGRKVGIFRAVQEGLIDRKVTVRLLEAQLFAGGIADPRSGHRLTIEEAVRHGLMDQDLACALFARQLQNGGILDPFCDGERLDLAESIQRGLLSPRLALLVLESLWSFMGMLWPKSGEILPINEAIQQGVISGELANNMLRQRHAVGALYNPETLQALPFNQTAKETLGPNIVHILQNVNIPDIIPNTNQSISPSRLSWNSSSSSTPPSSPLASTFPAPPVWEVQSMTTIDPEEEAKQKLLFHIMTHSYMDAHTGRRLVLLDTELLELVTALDQFVEGENQPEGKGIADELGQELVENYESIEGLATVEVDKVLRQASEIVRLQEMRNGKDIKLPAVKREKDDVEDKYNNVKDKPSKTGSFEIVSSSKVKDISDDTVVAKPMATDGATTVSSQSEKVDFTQIRSEYDLAPTQLENTKPQFSPVLREVDGGDKGLTEDSQDEKEMSRLIEELKVGGLKTPEGDRLLPDEAVAQGILTGQTAVKLMSEAGLFGGFVDASSGESFSVDDLTQDGLEGEDLMWSILKSDKTLSGVVDSKKGKILGVTEAAKEGLIDANTCNRLLEAQVVSGGIVDLRRDKKLSVTLASNMGLIEEEQKDPLIALEKAYKGKKTNPETAMVKAALQLQIEGIVDPETKCPVPLERAVQKGLIKPEDVCKVLAKQVAEGGIVHHESRLRLSVADAVDRGLVDRSFAPGLEELEWVYQGKISQSSNPEAVVLQASTGSILDPSSGQKLTLTEAVSKGLLDKSMADKAMASPTIAQGAIDPQTARIVPYSDLVNQGKIDIETGKRFLEIKPFRGVKDEKTGDTFTLPQAIASNKVDPIPALRVLQSQADTGGIIDIKTGERVCLADAIKKDLVEDHMVKTIATNQLKKSGLVDPFTGRVPSFSDANAEGRITKEIAFNIEENLPTLETESLDSSSTPVASSESAHSPAITLSICSADSLETWSDSNTDSRSMLYEKSLIVAPEKTSTGSEQSTEEVVQIEQDKSLDVLSKFAVNVEKKIQKAIEEIVPQKEDDELNSNAKETSTLKAGDGKLEIGVKECVQDGSGMEESQANSQEQICLAKHESRPEDKLSSKASHGNVLLGSIAVNRDLDLDKNGKSRKDIVSLVKKRDGVIERVREDEMLSMQTPRQNDKDSDLASSNTMKDDNDTTMTKEILEKSVVKVTGKPGPRPLQAQGKTNIQVAEQKVKDFSETAIETQDKTKVPDQMPPLAKGKVKDLSLKTMEKVIEDGSGTGKPVPKPQPAQGKTKVQVAEQRVKDLSDNMDTMKRTVQNSANILKGAKENQEAQEDVGRGIVTKNRKEAGIVAAIETQDKTKVPHQMTPLAKDKVKDLSQKTMEKVIDDGFGTGKPVPKPLTAQGKTKTKVPEQKVEHFPENMDTVKSTVDDGATILKDAKESHEAQQDVGRGIVDKNRKGAEIVKAIETQDKTKAHDQTTPLAKDEVKDLNLKTMEKVIDGLGTGKPGPKPLPPKGKTKTKITEQRVKHFSENMDTVKRTIDDGANIIKGAKESQEAQDHVGRGVAEKDRKEAEIVAAIETQDKTTVPDQMTPLAKDKVKDLSPKTMKKFIEDPVPKPLPAQGKTNIQVQVSEQIVKDYSENMDTVRRTVDDSVNVLKGAKESQESQEDVGRGIVNKNGKEADIVTAIETQDKTKVPDQMTPLAKDKVKDLSLKTMEKVIDDGFGAGKPIPKSLPAQGKTKTKVPEQRVKHFSENMDTVKRTVDDSSNILKEVHEDVGRGIVDKNGKEAEIVALMETEDKTKVPDQRTPLAKDKVKDLSLKTMEKVNEDGFGTGKGVPKPLPAQGKTSIQVSEQRIKDYSEHMDPVKRTVQDSAIIFKGAKESQEAQEDVVRGIVEKNRKGAEIVTAIETQDKTKARDQMTPLAKDKVKDLSLKTVEKVIDDGFGTGKQVPKSLPAQGKTKTKVREQRVKHFSENMDTVKRTVHDGANVLKGAKESQEVHEDVGRGIVEENGKEAEIVILMETEDKTKVPDQTTPLAKDEVKDLSLKTMEKVIDDGFGTGKPVPKSLPAQGKTKTRVPEQKVKHFPENMDTVRRTADDGANILKGAKESQEAQEDVGRGIVDKNGKEAEIVKLMETEDKTKAPDQTTPLAEYEVKDLSLKTMEKIIEDGFGTGKVVPKPLPAQGKTNIEMSEQRVKDYSEHMDPVKRTVQGSANILKGAKESQETHKDVGKEAEIVLQMETEDKTKARDQMTPLAKDKVKDLSLKTMEKAIEDGQNMPKPVKEKKDKFAKADKKKKDAAKKEIIKASTTSASVRPDHTAENVTFEEGKPSMESETRSAEMPKTGDTKEKEIKDSTTSAKTHRDSEQPDHMAENVAFEISKPSMENESRSAEIPKTGDTFDQITISKNIDTKGLTIEEKVQKVLEPKEAKIESFAGDVKVKKAKGKLGAKVHPSESDMVPSTSNNIEPAKTKVDRVNEDITKPAKEGTKRSEQAKDVKKIKQSEMKKPLQIHQAVKPSESVTDASATEGNAVSKLDYESKEKFQEAKDEALTNKDKQVDVASSQATLKISQDVEPSAQNVAPPSKDMDTISKKKRRNKKAKGNGADGTKELPKVTSEVAKVDANLEKCPDIIETPATPSSFNERENATGPEQVQEVEVGDRAAVVEAAPVVHTVKEPEAKLVNGRKKTNKAEKANGNGQSKNTVEVQEGKEKEGEGKLPQKSALPENEKAALVLKAKESILKKVFEKGVSEKQAAEELQAIRKEVGRKDKDEHGKTVKPEVEKEEISKSIQMQMKEKSVGELPTKKKVIVQESGGIKDKVDEAKEVALSKADNVSPAALKEVSEIQLEPVKETQPKKQQKKHKKAKIEMEKAHLDTDKPLAKEKMVSEKTCLKETQDSQDLSESKIDCQKGLAQSEESSIGLTKTLPVLSPDLLNAGDLSQSDLEANKSCAQTATKSKAFNMEETTKGKEMETKFETENLPKTETIEQQTVEPPKVLETVASALSQDLKSDKGATPLTEDETKAPEVAILKNQGSTSKSSLKKQECLELDQQIVALVSMVRHIEVQLKQQQQQSVGRSLIALNDIIRQTESLDLELRDLEPQIHTRLQAAERLLSPKPEDVPPQLLLALEKDVRSLSRGYEAARALSEDMRKSLLQQRDAHKEAVAAELKSLGGRVDALLSWLKETEAQMSEQTTRTEDREETGPNQLTQQLELCKELQDSLTSRSSDVNDVAFDIQMFISERAQDLAPEQSRQVLGHLQQLQRAFHQATGHVHAWAGALSAQRDREERSKEQERSRESAKEREVVQQQKSECSQKMESLAMYLAGAASLLASHVTGGQTGDVNALQEKQKKLKEVQKDLQSKSEGIAEAIRTVEDLLAEKGDSLSPEERANLQGALEKMKEQYSTLTDTANTSLSEVDTAISTTVQQNTQRAKAEEELQETQGQIDSLLNELSSLSQPGAKRNGFNGALDVSDAAMVPPEGAVESHTDKLQAELQQLQSQQAQLMQVSQSVRSLLEQPDSAVPPEEKRRLRAALDQLQAQHQDRLHSCQDRLRKSEALKDELTKFLQEHGGLVSWLDQSEQELRSLGEGETDAQGLKGRMEEHRRLSEDVICHKADLRFVSISGQKVLDSVQGALEQLGGSDPAMESTKQLVSDKLHDANHRYTALHTKSTELGGRLSGLLERYQHYQDEMVSLHSWLSAQEQNQSIAKSTVDTDPQNLQNTLRQVQLLQDELAERSVQLEKVKRAGQDLVSTEESPSLKAVDILCAADGLEKRFGSLSSSVSERAEQLQTAVAQSVSVQEGLRTLLSWLDQLPLNPAPVQPTAQAVQDALTQNQKLRQELLSRMGSVDATRDAVSKLLQSSDASTASGLKGSLDQLTQRFSAAQASQAEREAELKTLLPRLESYERLGMDLQLFTQSRLKALSPVGQPDRSVEDYRQTIEEVKSELDQESGQLKSFCGLGSELSQSKTFTNTQSLLENVREVSDEFNQLETSVNKRFAAIQACEQQLHQFRGLSGSLLRWLQTAQDQLPAKETSPNTDGLQRRVQQLKDLLNDWESHGSRVQELNKNGSELETIIIDITAPQTKTGAPQINGSSGRSSLNGIHTCKDLTELQVAVSDVNSRYEALGSDLQERLSKQQSSLELRQKASQGTDELKGWLSQKESSFTQAQVASPSKTEVVRAQAQENKALLSELAERSAKVEELKSTLRKLIAENPDSPEAETWRQQLQEIDSRWQATNQTAAQRQKELETCADRLGTFSSAANQLAPWLREKELMMSVLGPLSIDPNMLNTQKQQVQFMLREFETRRPQFDQLTQSAEGILSQSDPSQEPKDLAEVRSELGSISQQWGGLTDRLTQREQHIEQAQGTSERYQGLLRELSSSVSALGERLDGQASLSAQPEALKQRLQETGEIRSELERRRGELAEAERLCQELSTIVVEPYLKEELKKRLDSVSVPLRSLEERAADGLSQLQAALSSTQQFQQMFEELRSWLDKQSDVRDASSVSLPCQPEAIRSLLSQTDELQRGIASQRGSYELLQAEGASLLASLPSGGDERTALQCRLTALKRDWEGLNEKISEREGKLKNTLAKAEAYQQHKTELVPWLSSCEERDREIQPWLEPSALDECVQKAKTLGLELERRQPHLEAFNTAADQLLEQCCIGDEEVRDEKAQLNRRVDRLGESVHSRTSHLEELAGRLKEFEEGRQAVERRLEAAKHQIEVQEALGPQACSAKSLERLRSQQDNLRSLQPQVVYLKDLARGLVQDAPQTTGGSTEGADRLQKQAMNTEKDYEGVTEKIETCCSSLESRLQGVGEVQSHVRDVFSRLADLDDELDSLSPVGRDADSLASQADALRGFLSRLGALRSELEGHAADCTNMLRREGSSPDLLALRRETEALSRQAGKLSERGQARLDQIEDASERVRDFYRQVSELQGLLGRAEAGLDAQAVVGTEVETIKQQLQEFKLRVSSITALSEEVQLTALERVR